MTKVGILSMQRIKNYGSFLQAYALKKILEKLGNEVEFVDYHVESPLIDNKKNSQNKISKGLRVLYGRASITQKLQYINHKRNFSKKYFKLLDIYEEKNYCPKLNVLVIGSDEVFNCVQENENVGYSLELFGKNNNAKKVISYAASFGNTTIEKLKKYNKIDEIAKLLNEFSVISVRDNNSENIVKKLTKKNAFVNLDPVLIYDYLNECQILKNIDIKEKFILVYAYSGRISKEESSYIKKVAKNYNLKVYAIGGVQECADKFIDCSPFEIFSYFKCAEMVITDTFHGSIFSIITHCNFVTIVRKSIGQSYGNEEKLYDLLERLNLKNRIVESIYDIEKILSNAIDYSKTDEIISEERKKAIKYLKDNI